MRRTPKRGGGKNLGLDLRGFTGDMTGAIPSEMLGAFGLNDLITEMEDGKWEEGSGNLESLSNVDSVSLVNNSVTPTHDDASIGGILSLPNKKPRGKRAPRKGQGLPLKGTHFIYKYIYIYIYRGGKREGEGVERGLLLRAVVCSTEHGGGREKRGS